MNFYDKVYELLRKIPVGKVTTYGDIAVMLGNPRASRAVGYALHNNPEPYVIPCHRVVDRFGHLATSYAFGGLDTQAELLRNEGVEVENDMVDLTKYRWINNDK